MLKDVERYFSFRNASSFFKTNWFTDLMVHKVGDGEDTLFWFDRLVQGGCFKER